jgi:hypothetical protein
VPIIANIDHTDRRIHSVALGRVTSEEVDHHLKLERHFNGLLYPEIIDARAANVDLTSDEVRTIVALVRAMSVENKFGPTAVIVSTDVEFGVMMLEALLDDVAAVSPCRSEAEDTHMAKPTP